MSHPALNARSVAVVTGAASGIGQASALRFAEIGMAVVAVDRDPQGLKAVEEQLRTAGARDVLTAELDVTDRAAFFALEEEVTARLGGADIVMNNAGVGGTTTCLSEPETWESILNVNLWGAIYGTQAFAPGMIARARPGAIINTGSKQGITTPPGNPAYNVSKAALKTYTEALAHELRNSEGSQITAHLLVPGLVYTGMIDAEEKPKSAWTAEQMVAFFFDSLDRGDFYILCPDNDVTPALDRKRIAWAAGDMIENRPALSRWHPDYAEAFAAFIKRP